MKVRRLSRVKWFQGSQRQDPTNVQTWKRYLNLLISPEEPVHYIQVKIFPEKIGV
jgi:hypothetical protein